MAVIGLDVGTTGCKAIVFGDGWEMLGEGRREYPIIAERPGQAEQDADLVWHRAVASVAEAVGRSGVTAPAALALSVQGEAVIPVDASGRPIRNAMLGMDTRSTAETRWLGETFDPEELFRRTGMPLHTMNTTTRENPGVVYRALSGTAIASLVLGLLSAVTVLHWVGALVPLTGIFLGRKALGSIRRAPNELTGATIAKLGIFLCISFWVLGYGWLLFARVSEVPYGYQRVTYDMLQPDPNVPGEKIPPDILKLQPSLNQDRKVFIKGYMAPGRQQTGLRHFILCPEIANCPFCIPDPKPTEMILITLEGDLTTDYTTHLVRVGGRLRVNPDAANQIPYKLEADYLR